MTQAKLEELGVESVFNIPYSPQFNGIEYIFSDIKRRFRAELTLLKADRDLPEVDLRKLINDTFSATTEEQAVKLCLYGWRNLLAGDDRCPEIFQGQRLTDEHEVGEDA